MPTREYKGDPIDATMQYINERSKKGETVAGTSKDDLHEENTIAVPSFVDTTEYDAEQLEMIEKAILNPEMMLKNLCDEYGFRYQKASSFLAKFRRKYKRQLKNAELWDAVTYGTNQYTDTDEKEYEEDDREKVKEYFKENTDAGARDAINALDIEPMDLSTISGLKSAALSQLEDEKEQQDAATENEQPAGEAVLISIKDLIDRVDALEATVKDMQTCSTNSDDPALGELSEDTLFAIVSGETLDDEQRREIFELIV